jgi:hypothetical protein
METDLQILGRAVQIGRLPPTSRILSVTVLTPTCHEQLVAGRQQKTSLLTSRRSVGEMFLLESVFELTRTACGNFWKYIYNKK